jgi:hypothetical protein
MQQDTPLPSPSRTMQWALLIITTVLTFAVIIVPALIFFLTRSLLGVIPSAGVLPLGYMWTCIVRHLFPKDPREYELATKRIEHADLRLPHKGPGSK